MDFTRSGATLGEAAVQYAKGLSCWFRDYLTAIKHGRIHPFTPLERKVREATRNEPWGPTGTLLNEITEASMDHNSCSVIFAVLEFRLKYPSEKWRNVYKALQVLEFILKRGSETHIADAKREFMELLRDLKDFNYIGADGRDYGVNVRVRSEAVKKLFEDENLLKMERAKLQKIHNKFRGYSRAEMEGNTTLEETTTIRSNSWGGSISMRSDNSREKGTSAPHVGRKSAGEMKGVSLEENKKHLQALKRILARSENRTCADCGDQMPTWASINCGVFLCLKCSGIHRSLGVHISKVRSCTLDTWLPEQVQFMDRTGNKVANEYWEAKLESHQKPACSSPLFASFVQQKYSQKMFASGVWPPSKDPVESLPPANGIISPAPVITAETFNQPTKPKSPREKPDLLTFEDEAFGSFTEVPKDVEFVVQKAEIQPSSSSPLQFENSALFEQRSSFLRLKSQINGDTNSSPNHPAHKSKTSQEVIHTTLLDFDDLESLSETMSLASSKNLNPIPSSAIEKPIERPPISLSPVQSSAPPVTLRPPKAPPIVVEVKKEGNVQPVMDLLDAPLTISSVTGDQGIDGLEDPFSFMPMSEPAAIMQTMEETKSAPIENKAIKTAPQTQPLVPVNQEWSSETKQVEAEANKDSSLNIQELSGLDALFVQQVDDFMHFGYLSNVTNHSYI